MVDVSFLNIQATQAIHAGNYLKARSLIGRALRLKPENPTAQALFSFLRDELPTPPEFLI